MLGWGQGADGEFWRRWQSMFGLDAPGATDSVNPFAFFQQLFGFPDSRRTSAWGAAPFGSTSWVDDQLGQLKAWLEAADCNSGPPSKLAEWFDLPPLGAGREWELQ